MGFSITGRRPAHVDVTQASMLVALCAAVDVLGGWIAGVLHVPVFLDTVGTFVAAAVLGPWWGAAAGTVNNVASALFNGPSSIPFAVVSIAVALVWGYGLRTFGLGRRTWTLFLLNIAVAVVAAFVSAPIVLVVYGGATGHASDALTAALEIAGKSLASAVLISNIALNIADKLITASIGLAFVEALPESQLAGLRLPGSTRLGILLIAALGVAIGIGVTLVYLALPVGA